MTQERIEWKPEKIEELKNLLIAGENRYDIAAHFHTNHKNIYDVVKRHNLKQFEFKKVFRVKRSKIFVDGMVNLNPPPGFNFLLGSSDSAPKIKRVYDMQVSTIRNNGGALTSNN